MNWPQIDLGDIAEFRNGLNYTKDSEGTGLRIISVKDFGNKFLPKYEELDEINPNGILRNEALLKHGDIIFVRSNGNKDLVGRSLFINNPPDNVSFSAFCIRVRMDESVNPRFYAYFFKTPNFRKKLSLLGRGTNISNLNQQVLRRLEVPNPLQPVKSKVVKLICSYDDLIENNRRRIALLEQAARLLYKEWFVHLRFPGHEHVRITDGVPEGWERKTLGDLCREVRELVEPDAVRFDTPYIGLEHILRRSISLNEWGRADQVTSSKHIFREGDILFGKIRPYFHKVGVTFIDGITSSDAIVIRSRDPVLHSLILMTLSSDPFVAVTAQTMREGSKMPRADWKQMQAYPIMLPPYKILSGFEAIIGSIVDQLKTLSFTNRRLSKARDLLLPRLMNGEIAV
jgi:type I restriction enzyme S subunit